MTSDLQADLDAIADELGRLVTLSWRERDDLADRLRHLLDDRNLTERVPLMRAADVNRIFQEDGAWQVAVALNVDGGAEWLPLNTVCAPASENPFLPDWPNLLVVAHEWGSTMPPVPTADPVEPATEWVRLDQVIGLRVPTDHGRSIEVANIKWHAASHSWRWIDADDDEHSGPLPIASDGTVEVLKATP
jgi:hypothetical protein